LFSKFALYNYNISPKTSKSQAAKRFFCANKQQRKENYARAHFLMEKMAPRAEAPSKRSTSQKRR